MAKRLNMGVAGSLANRHLQYGKKMIRCDYAGTAYNKLMEMKAKTFKDLANHEIVTLAVYLLGGDSQRFDTEDIAKKADELAPGRFTWRKYLDQINIDTVRKRLWDSTKPDKGGFLLGTEKDGWMLTDAGLRFAKSHVRDLEQIDLSRRAMNSKERNLIRRERERMFSSDAFTKFSANQADSISLQEAESFFRVDAYVTGEARMEKILRAKNRFGEDPDLGPLITLLESKLAEGDSIERTIETRG